MARVQLDVRLDADGDESVLQSRFAALAPAAAPVVARERPGLVFLVIASADPDPPTGPPGGEDPSRSLGHGTPAWEVPAWARPAWDEPAWQDPTWDPPSWDRPSWGSPTWGAPSWTTSPAPDGLPLPADAVAASLTEPPASIAFEVVPASDSDRLFLDLDVPQPVAPVLVGLVHCEPADGQPATLRVHAAALLDGYDDPLLRRCLQASLRRLARTRGFTDLEGLESLTPSRR